MRSSKSKLTLLGAVVVVGLFGLHQAFATPASPAPVFVSTTLGGPATLEEFQSKTVNDDGHRIKLQTKGVSDVYVTNIKIQPGGQGGWHSHPGPSIICVKAGEATFYDDCDGATTPHRYTAGKCFVEDAGCVHILKNEGSVDVEIYVMQIVPEGAPRRIDAASPL
jgi:quercetin dioxygenase-like cupin family protein